jgi:hypothetical protein
MRSATLKGLVIHTADEAGDAPGPDYKMGWGLVNIAKAATVITNNGTKDLIEENVLNQGGTKTYNVIASGDGTITATLSWTDPKASVETPGTATALNNPNVKLVDDLDIVVKKGATVYRSWILNPVNRDNAATRGNNTLDNVEKVEVPDVVPGDAYTIEITHKGTLERGTQAYSVIVSGIGGKAYCTSAPSVNTGSRIDSVSFTNIKNKNAAGCTSYSNFTNLIGNVEAGQAFPLFIRLNSCDATAVDKIVKVFIDANNDGDFDDAGEILATSPVLNGDQDYTPTITLPSSLSVGKYTVLRIVAQETNTATAVTPCGTYTKGETQDYRVQVTTPSNDVGIAELVSPQPADCASGAQFVAVRIRNYGNTLKTNVPVSAVIKQGATTVNTFNAIFAGKIPANSSVVYVFQQPFIAAPGTAYMITTSTSLAGDQNVSNNQNITSVTTSPSSTDPSGTAVICGTTAQLKATPATDIYTWYNSAAATVPIASGSNTVTATILPTYFLARNENNLSIGPANKDLFPSGNYNEFQNFFMVFNNTVPVTIETVRFYIGNANSTGKLQLILGRNFSVSGGTINFLPEGIVDLDIYATDPTPAPGMQPNDPTDQGAVFYVHLPVPVTGDHMLMIHNPSNTDLTSMYRNNLITTSPYPVGISGLFTFTDNYVTYATPPDNFQAFYYFFYDLRLKLQGCPAPARKTITATTTPTPSITLVGNVFTSSEAAGNQWLKDGFSITGQTGQTFTATESGNYSTQVTNANGCVLNSNNINFVATAIPTVDPSRIGLVVSPVPARKDFSIQLEVNTKADLDISLISTSGQTVYHSATPDFIGRFNKTINTGTVGAGVYYLQVIHDRKKYIRKVVIIQ